MTIFKALSAEDRVSTKTLLHEAIPITGTILSGTYSDNNIQNFTHGMFQSFRIERVLETRYRIFESQGI